METKTPTKEQVLAKVDHMFTFRPYTEGQRASAKEILSAANHFAVTLVNFTKEGPDQTAALRKIKEAVTAVLDADDLIETVASPATPA